MQSGSRAIGEVIERMTGLANWLAANKPQVRCLTLRQRDLDVLRRYPEAAAFMQVDCVDGVLWWRGFELHAEGNGRLQR